MTRAGAKARREARQAAGSTVVDRLARLGLLSRAAVWLVVGLLALQIAAGGRAEADRKGALRAIADRPFGSVLLAVLVIGFLGYGAWRLLEAGVGHTDADGSGRWARRFASLCRGVAYLGLAASTTAFLLHGSRHPDTTSTWSGRLMAQPAGRWLVGLVGAGVVVGGLALGVYGLRQKFLDKLRPVRHAGFVRAVGSAGLAGRGLVFALIGYFLTAAAVKADPHEARGLDAALKTLAGQPYGVVLLVVAAVGLLSFAAWSVCEAVLRRIAAAR